MKNLALTPKTPEGIKTMLIVAEEGSNESIPNMMMIIGQGIIQMLDYLLFEIRQQQDYLPPYKKE